MKLCMFSRMTLFSRRLLQCLLLILIICCLLLQDARGRPRLRHNHRKFRCSKCGPGWGVAQPCSSSHDTQCELCGPGRYSPHHSFKSPCWLCSRCGPGLYEAHPCRPEADTVCDDCHRVGILVNPDFVTKCLNSPYVPHHSSRTTPNDTLENTFY